MNIRTNELLLISGNDIPFVEGSLVIHPPTLREISYLGEQTFFEGCELLKFSKENLSSEDKSKLSHLTDFNILMQIINDKKLASQFHSESALMVLDLLFPNYVLAQNAQLGIMIFTSKEDPSQVGHINSDNFDAFKDILKVTLCLDKTSSSTEYNPSGDLAKKIADKFKKRNQKLAELKSKPNKVSVFSRYVSILTVGTQQDFNSIMNYTVYQLFDQFERLQLKIAYDSYVKARLAGAKDIKEPEDWMKDVHE